MVNQGSRPGQHRGNDEDARYPIRVVARRTGLSSHVIRVWERRYAAVTPLRSENGYRHYSEADIDRLRGLRELTEAGYGIGDIADLGETALAELLDQKRAVVGPPPEPRSGDAGPSELTVPVARSTVWGAVSSWDAARLAAALREAAVRLPLDVFLEDVLVDLLRRLGEEWHRGELSPASEHMVSAAVPGVLAWVAERLPEAEDTAPLAVFATPTGARHELGARIAELVARSEGWRTLFLGSDLPASDIVNAARENAADVVAVSVVYPADDPGIRAELAALVAGLEGVSRLYVGGAGSTGYSDLLDAPNVEGLSDLATARKRFDAA